MKKINASFRNKDYSKKYGMTAAIRRGSRENGIDTGDPKALPLVQNEISHDDIVVKVYDGSLFNVIAICHAHVSEVTPSSIPFGGATIYSEVRQASTAYAAQQLNAKKASFTQYDAPTLRLLTIEAIEVSKEYHRQGIATSIIDYLNTLTKAEIIIGFAIPYFESQIDAGGTSQTTTDIHGLEKLMKVLGFEHNGKIRLMGAGTPIEINMYKLKP